MSRTAFVLLGIVLGACAAPARPPFEARLSPSTARQVDRSAVYAIEIKGTEDLREMDIDDPVYLGELVLEPSTPAVRAAIPAAAAQASATHFRVEHMPNNTFRVQLLHVSPLRWTALPKALQPTRL